VLNGGNAREPNGQLEDTMTDRHAIERRRPIAGLRLLRLLVLLLPILLLACSTGGGDDDDDATPVPTQTATATVSPTSTALPTPSPTPTVEPSPTVYIPPTVAVTDDDSIQSCLERNLTAELLISLSMDDTSLTEDVMRTCLETTIPPELTFFLNPIIDDASQCALEVSKTLSNEELIALGGDNSARKDEITDRVVSDILSCLGSKYGFDFL